MCRKFIQKVVSYFFETPSQLPSRFSNIFWIFLQVLLGDFFNFYIYAKFTPSFPKTITKFFRIPKFHQKLRNTNFCTPMLLQCFFKISSQNNFSTNLAIDFKMSQWFSKKFYKVTHPEPTRQNYWRCWQDHWECQLTV